jgi:hypothetical protein
MHDPRRWLEVLGLGPDATKQQIDLAYRDLVKVWHPDRFESDPSLRLKATQKLRELNAAYDGLRRSGIPPRDPPPTARAETAPTPSHERPPTPKTASSRSGRPWLFGAVLVATAAAVGTLLFYEMRRDRITPTYIVVVPDPKPETTQPREAQRRNVAPTVPTPPADAPTAGTLMVLSQPSGGTVYVNDDQVGRTPLTLASIPPGAYRVRVELEDHPVWSSSVQIDAGASEKLIAFMAKGALTR